jgi:hypothetical protein
MATALEVLRNCRRDEPIADRDLDFSIAALIPRSDIQVKGKTGRSLDSLHVVKHGFVDYARVVDMGHGTWVS